MRGFRVLCAALALATAAAFELHRPGDARAQALALADLAVTKTALPASVPPGGDITYTITVTNGGPSDAQGVALGDTLPPGTTFQSLAAPTGWVCQTPQVGSTGQVLCGLAALAAGAAAGPQTFTLVVRTAPGAPAGTPIVNMVDVRSGVPGPGPGQQRGDGHDAGGAPG